MGLAFAAALVGVIAAVGCGERKERPVGPQGTLHYQLGIKAYNDGRYADAIAAFEKALVFNPGLTEAYLDIAAIADDYLHDRNKAILYYKEYITRSRSFEMRQRVRGWLAKVESQGEETRDKPVDFSAIGQAGVKTIEILQGENARLKSAVEKQRDAIRDLTRTVEELRGQKPVVQASPPNGSRWPWIAMSALCVIGAGSAWGLARARWRRRLVSHLPAVEPAKAALTPRQIVGRYAWVENEFHSGTMDIVQHDGQIRVETRSRETHSRANGLATLDGIVLNALLRNEHGETAATTFTFSLDGATFVAHWKDTLGQGRSVGIRER